MILGFQLRQQLNGVVWQYVKCIISNVMRRRKEIKLKTKTKFVISDRRERVWNNRCDHEINWKSGKTCNKLLDEDTGECPKGHGRSLHACATSCCGILVAGNHKFCRYHRKKKVKTICNIQNKIMKEYSRRMGWTGKFRGVNIDTYEGKIDFEEWKQKQLQKSYDKEVVQQEKHEFGKKEKEYVR